MLHRNPYFAPVAPGYDTRWFLAAASLLWLALFVACLIVGAFLAGWSALPVAALFACTATARILDAIAT